MFKEVADIKTADMLELPVPEAHFHNVAVKPSEMQKEMVASLAERAEKVRGGGVDSSVDNMLKITNDGRKLALDQRMLNDMLPDFEGSKINACVDNIYRIWEETADKKSAQLVFCDLSTPKNDGTFSVYNDIRKKAHRAWCPRKRSPLYPRSRYRCEEERTVPKDPQGRGQSASRLYAEDGSRHECSGQTYRTSRCGLPVETVRLGAAFRSNYPSGQLKP